MRIHSPVTNNPQPTSKPLTTFDLHAKFLMCLIMISLFNFSGCTYKSPSTEVPVAVDNEIPKTFFVKSEVDAKSGKTINIQNKFLCGWASEMETGFWAEMFYTNNAMVPEHCNLVFEITESRLIGKLVNPSFPNDSSRWANVLTIPISSHYYIEKEKDDSGRETNRLIRNTSRSHWSARPYMQLDLEGISLEGAFASNEGWWGLSAGTTSVEKIEWDTKNGFLGFTINKALAQGSHTRLRFNIKQFETNPKFNATAFNDKNYKKMNILHIIGEKVQGIYPILRAAHWDLTKKIELRLWEVPEKYKPIMQEVVADWNDALRTAKATTMTDGPFVINDSLPNDHAFDLRYPTIAWVSDDKISTYSPLGIGMALADVKNGEIKWGMITLYTGYIEKYLKGSLDTTAVGSNGGASGIAQKLARSMTAIFKNYTNVDLPEAIRAISYQTSVSRSATDSLAHFFTPEVPVSQPNPAQMLELKKSGKSDKEISLLMQAQATEQYNKNLDTNSLNFEKFLQKIHADGSKEIQKLGSQVKARASVKGIQGLLNTPFLKYSQGLSAATAPINSAEAQEKMIKRYSGPTACLDRTIGDVLPGLVAAMKQGQGGSDAGLANDERALRTVIKELTTHEYGHFLGLGHQFKENILPVKGSVPDEAYNKLAEKANAKNHFTNYSSVMGYRYPTVEFNEKSNMKPGPHDILVLRYLYANQYSTFKLGDVDFTFFDMPSDGIIPEFNPQKSEYKTSYFPQCNDIQATLEIDPYCNRFDIGSTAVQLVQSYFDNLNRTMVQRLYSFTDATGRNVENAEAGMWWKGFTTMSRVRVFYDYMRKMHRESFEKFRKDEQSILDFSKACQTDSLDDIANETLREAFREDPELKDLCKANVVALNEMEKIIALDTVDFSKMNPKNQFMPGGMDGGDTSRDWSQWLGTWEELTAFPLKYTSLFALTTSKPWWIWGGWFYNNEFYDRGEDGYSYMFLYPREYTRIMATNIKKNLKFSSFGQSDKTVMGRSVLSMSWLNFEASYGSNDPNYFPARYVSKVRNQQVFNLGLVAVILTGKPKQGGDPSKVVRWDGVVYDFASGRSTPISSAYILPGGKVIASASQMFMFPISEFTPYDDFAGYYFAYRVDYVRDLSDGLSDISVKNDLKDYHNRIYDICVRGTESAEAASGAVEGNGLASFFSPEESQFEGFQMGKGMARTEESVKEFTRSVNENFKKYYASEKYKAHPPQPETCEEALRGLGLIVTTSASLNGYWLPELFDIIQK